MNFNHLAEFLATTEMFKGLPQEQLNLLAAIARCQTYQKNEIIFLQGDEGRGFFMIKSGKLKVFQASAAGKEIILHLFKAGEHFAEVAAFDGGDFPASASAIELTEILFFPRSDFLQLLDYDPSLAINLLATFARRLRHFARLVEDLSLKEVPGRLAAYLLDLSENNDNTEILELEITKGQLAAVLGTIPETLSRAFAKLIQEGSIAISGSSIQLLDKNNLLKRAGKIAEI